jgi:hypothetical protein
VGFKTSEAYLGEIKKKKKNKNKAQNEFELTVGCNPIEDVLTRAPKIIRNQLEKNHLQ